MVKGATDNADGNTLTGGGRTNTWDSQNRLVQSVVEGTTCAYKYGADGLHRSSTVNGTSIDYAYDGSMLVREGHASGGTLTPATVTATYLIGARGPESGATTRSPAARPAGTSTTASGAWSARWTRAAT